LPGNGGQSPPAGLRSACGLAARAATAALAFAVAVAADAAEYRVEKLVGGPGIHGIHGLAFDAEDRLYVGSVVGQSIYRVDVETGALETFLGPPEGMADDLEFGPGGLLVWTSFLEGKVRAREGDGPIRVLASDLPGANSLAFRGDGRLFASQVFLGDALWEIDLDGREPPRLVAKDLGGLNGFDFGADGALYGPLWSKGEVARIDVTTGEVATLAKGWKTPAAANFDSKGSLFVLDHADGSVWRVDPDGGARFRVATLAPGVDNLAFDSHDRLFVTGIPHAQIHEVDLEQRRTRTLRESPLAMPGDVALVARNGRTRLAVADLFAERHVDPGSGRVFDLGVIGGDPIDYPTAVGAGKRFTWYAGWYSGALHKTDRTTGRSLRMWREFQAPMDVLELEDGSVLAVEWGGKLLRVTGAEESERAVVASGLEGPVSLAAADSENVYVCLHTAGSIVRVELATGKKTLVAADLAGPEGIAVGPDGRIYAAEVGERRVVAIEPAGGERAVIAAGLPIGLPAPPGVPPPFVITGVAVDAAGVVYVSSDLEDAIYRLVPE
jgi:sugar lactone lactonase YvrE